MQILDAGQTLLLADNKGLLSANFFCEADEIQLVVNNPELVVCPGISCEDSTMLTPTISFLVVSVAEVDGYDLCRTLINAVGAELPAFSRVFDLDFEHELHLGRDFTLNAEECLIETLNQIKLGKLRVRVDRQNALHLL